MDSRQNTFSRLNVLKSLTFWCAGGMKVLLDYFMASNILSDFYNICWVIGLDDQWESFIKLPLSN